MKFYVQKTTKVYIISEGDKNTLPLLVMDFRFLEFDFFDSLHINFNDGYRESEAKNGTIKLFSLIKSLHLKV